MAKSIGEQIMEAMLAALNAPSVKPARTSRSRVDPLNTVELPAFVLFAQGESITAAGGSTRRHIRKVRLEAMVEGVEPADVLLDPLYVYAVNTLLADPTFGGLAKGCYESAIEWGQSASYQNACVALIDFEVHWTTTNDPSAPGLQ